MDDCVFCKIIAGSIPANIVYQDDAVLAILDILPFSPGHTLVVPKEHIDHLEDSSDLQHQSIFQVVHKISQKLIKVYAPERVGLIVAGYDVPHAHVHVFQTNQGSDIPFPKRMNDEPNFNELKNELEKIKS